MGNYGVVLLFSVNHNGFFVEKHYKILNTLLCLDKFTITNVFIYLRSKKKDCYERR